METVRSACSADDLPCEWKAGVYKQLQRFSDKLFKFLGTLAAEGAADFSPRELYLKSARQFELDLPKHTHFSTRLEVRNHAFACCTHIMLLLVAKAME
jgi:hypothetical protein